ncbi:unnamed protein product, partial [marine sediment metagenome]
MCPACFGIVPLVTFGASAGGDELFVPQLIYDARDNNILSLAIDKEGFIYAGCDRRGLIYKINPASGRATVLYDSEQEEITSLLFDEQGNLYAAATSAKAVQDQDQFKGITARLSGRPDTTST